MREPELDHSPNSAPEFGHPRERTRLFRRHRRHLAATTSRAHSDLGRSSYGVWMMYRRGLLPPVPTVRWLAAGAYPENDYSTCPNPRDERGGQQLTIGGSSRTRGLARIGASRSDASAVSARHQHPAQCAGGPLITARLYGAIKKCASARNDPRRSAASRRGGRSASRRRVCHMNEGHRRSAAWERRRRDDRHRDAVT